MTATITVNISEKTAGDFRRMAAMVYGKGKGYLGKAVEEAFSGWMNLRGKKSSEVRLFEMLETGVGAGGLARYKREELYDL